MVQCVWKSDYTAKLKMFRVEVLSVAEDLLLHLTHISSVYFVSIFRKSNSPGIYIIYIEKEVRWLHSLGVKLSIVWM